jgi:Zn-dependent protease with chaperone function
VAAPLLLIPLALEWVILVTTLAPLLLVGKFSRHPVAGITIWLLSFVSSGISLLLAVGIAIWGYFETLGSLQQNEFGGQEWFLSLVVSFAPWLALAVGGVSLALINQKLEPLVIAARSVEPLLNLSKTPLLGFMNIPVSTIDLPFAYAVATRREILISNFVVERLTQKELEAILWHELCHVRQLHFTLKKVARLIREISPRLVASRALVNEVERLIELAADKYAIRKIDKEVLLQARSLFTTS